MGCAASQEQTLTETKPETIRKERLEAADCAVSVLWLASVFLRTNPDVRGKAYTAQQVHERVINEAIRDKSCTYADQIEAAALSDGKLYSIVALSPSQPFADLIEQLYNYYKAKDMLDDAYVWIPMFCTTSSTASLDTEGLEQVFRRSQSTLLAIDSQVTVLSNPEALVLSWLSVMNGRKKLKLLASEAHLQSLISKLSESNLASAVARSDALTAFIRETYNVDVNKMGDEIKGGLIDSILSKLMPNEEMQASDLSRQGSEVSQKDSQSIMGKSNSSRLSRSGSARVPKDRSSNGGVSKDRSSNGGWSRNLSHQLMKMAGVAKQMGRLDLAERLHRQDLAGKSAVLGKEHPHYLASVSNLTAILIEAGKLRDAEVILRESLADQELHLGPGHKTTLTSLNNLACVLRDQGRLEEAEPMLTKALKAREELLGLSHPDTLASLNNLANFNRQIGKHEDSEAMFREVLKRREEALGDNHFETIASRSSLSVVLRQSGQLEEAEELQRTSVQQRAEVLGADHPTLKAQSRLAWVHVEKQEFETALEMYSEVYEGRVMSLGPDHKDTIEALKLVRELGQRVERMSRAQEIKQRMPSTILEADDEETDQEKE